MASNTPQANLNQSPGERFRLSNTRIASHRNMVDLDIFQEAVDHAVLEMAHREARMVNPANTTDYCLSAARLQGAQQFLEILRNLSEIPRVSNANVITPTLDHKA